MKNGKKFGEELLIPTRIYHESLKVAAACPVHGMCHVTGGGLLNFKRLSEYGFLFDAPIKPPQIFSWIQKAGDITATEMYRTFNMGMGFAYVVPKKNVASVLQMVKGTQVVGKVIKEPGVFLGNLEIV
jgi:phosphoribosylformylglycinamidine cyclo-ligase